MWKTFKREWQMRPRACSAVYQCAQRVKTRCGPMRQHKRRSPLVKERATNPLGCTAQTHQGSLSWQWHGAERGKNAREPKCQQGPVRLCSCACPRAPAAAPEARRLQNPEVSANCDGCQRLWLQVSLRSARRIRARRRIVVRRAAAGAWRGRVGHPRTTTRPRGRHRAGRALP